MDTFETFDCPFPTCHNTVGINRDVVENNPDILVRCIGASVGTRHVLQWMVRRMSDILIAA